MSKTPHKFSRTKVIFEGALALRGDDRERFITQECRGDAGLEASIRELVLLSEASGGILDRTPGQMLRDECPDALKIGDRLGNYTIDRIIGEGGMGQVYQATQASPRREVALKVIRGTPSRHAIRRFAQEAFVLGRLNHPGIAAVIESSLESGHPFIAMELVRGVPITQYATANALPLEARLSLIANVCDALHYTHVKGVVHRDIKPANVLVTAEGQPRILDFGVARLLESDDGLTMTAVGQLVGTLGYMSPEQTSTDSTRVDVRSDVYAMGVMLYEMVCGRMPLDVSSSGVAVAIACIQDERPESPRTIDRSIPVDVETIIMRALEKDPSRRYQHASELAADLRRYLNYEPILARPASAWYQLARFTRRNRFSVGVAAAALLMLVASLVVVSLAFLRARNAESQASQQAAAATEEAARNKRLSDFLRAMLGVDVEQLTGRDTRLVHEIFAKAESRLTTLEGDPLTRVAILAVLGNAYRDFGYPTDSLRLLREAASESERLKGGEHVDTLFAKDALAATLQTLGEREEAAQILEGVLGSRRRMDNDLPRLVVTISNYASTLSGLGRLEEAAKLQQEAAEIYGELGQSTKELAMRGRMAGTLARQGNVEDAEQKMRLVIAELENLEGPDHPEAVTLKVDLAVLLQAKGRYKESEPLLEECLSAARRVGGRLSTYELLLLDRLSKTKYSLDKFDEAVECTRTLLPLIRESRGEDSIAYWGAHANLASFLISAGKAEEGEKIARFARDNLARIAPEGCYFTPHALETLADALNAQKKYRDEIPPLEAAYAHYTSDAFADREAARVVAGRLMQAYEAIADTESAAIWRARYTDEPETTELPAELPANGGT